MKINIRRASAITAVVLSIICGSLHAQVNVTTYHNDVARTGQFTQETVLTPSNVRSSQFGKLFTTAVDGRVYAQPLYLSNVSIGGSTHNVLYVATDHDSLYAIDADSGAVYWQFNLIPASGTTVDSSADLNCGDLVPEVGITGTPVIDASTGTIYLVAKSKVGSNYYQYLHAIDVSTAAEKFGGPVSIQAAVPGTATDGNGTSVSFNPLLQNQRAALLLDNGHVMIGWSSHCDISPWHGWVMSYSASTLTQEAVYNTSPNASSNGVWMGGGGLAADVAGNIYFATGNGPWDGTSALGDSIVKLGPPSSGSFTVVDYFTPYNQAVLEASDEDMASGGLVLLPTLPSGQELLAQMGKAGMIYLVDRNNMGKYCVNQTPACSGSDSQIVQELPNATVGVWGSPAYWNGYIYWGGASDGGTGDHLKAFSLNSDGSGLLSSTPTSQSSKLFRFSAPVPSISANGTTAGILWGLDDSAFESACTGSANCQVLYAYDATNLATMLYNSSDAAKSRDVPGGAVKFATPIIANGKVYFGSQNAVSGFGLITSGVRMNPVPGNFTAAQSVTLADDTDAAVIYYTTDGTEPTTTSAVYTGPLQVSATTTINAVAVAPHYSMSALASGTYSIGPVTTTSNVNVGAVANVYALGTNGAAVPGTGIDDNGHAYSVTLLGASATWSDVNFTFGSPDALDAVSNTTLTLPNGNFSKLYVLATAVSGSAPNQDFVVTYTDGTSTTFTQSVSDWFTPQDYAGESIAKSEPYRLNPDGSTDNRTFYLYGYIFALNSAKTVQSLVLPRNPHVVVLAVTLQSLLRAMAPVTLAPPPGQFTTSQTVTLSDSAAGAIIHYTTDGSTPTTNSAVYQAALHLSTTSTIKAIAVAAGYSPSAVASGTYTKNAGSASVAATVTLSPPPGHFTTAQSVILSDSTVGAVIHFTTDGSTPTTGSAVYRSPLPVSAIMTIKAIAVAPGYSPSAVASGTYTESSTSVAAPVALSPAPNSFSTAQAVTLTDSTAGAVIYFTTDGSTPTTGSPIYRAPVQVDSTLTIKAIAAAPGLSPSPVASGTYTIASVTVTGPSKSGGGALDVWVFLVLAVTYARRLMTGVSSLHPLGHIRP